jgi:glycerol-3-phosphate acyltransferase PlsX
VISGAAEAPGPAGVRVALDLMGGDSAPDAVVDGALLVADEHPDVTLILVGPADVAAACLAARGAAGRFEVVAADEVVGMGEDPARAVRAKRDATVRVAARLVRDGQADATVSAGSTGAAMAAAVFTLGRLTGMTRPAVAVVVPAAAHPVVLLDAGANVDCEPSLLAQFALAGAAYASVRLGLDSPRVALLSNGEEPGKGDDLRKRAYDLLADLPIDFVGNVEGHDVPLGGRADVVVTDGFTGNVLLKGLEGALRMAGAGSGGRADTEPGGAVLLGVKGVSVVAHGSSSPRAIASAVLLAAGTARDGLVPRTAAALDALVARRRADAGLEVLS